MSTHNTLIVLCDSDISFKRNSPGHVRLLANPIRSRWDTTQVEDVSLPGHLVAFLSSLLECLTHQRFFKKFL